MCVPYTRRGLAWALVVPQVFPAAGDGGCCATSSYDGETEACGQEVSGQDWNPGLLLPGLVASGSSLHLPELNSSISKMGLAGSTSVEWCQGQNTPHGAWPATGVLWEMLLSVWESAGPTSPYSTPEPFGGFEQHLPALEPQFPHL